MNRWKGCWGVMPLLLSLNGFAMAGEGCVDEFVSEKIRLYDAPDGKAVERVKWRALDEFKNGGCVKVLAVDEKNQRTQLQFSENKYWVKTSKVASGKKLVGVCIDTSQAPGASSRAAGECGHK